MGWTFKTGGVKPNPGGGSTLWKTEVNDQGDTRTTTVKRDAARNVIFREVKRRNKDGSEESTLDQTLPGGTKVHETSNRKANGDRTVDRTETDPRGNTKRTKRTSTRTRNKIEETTEEYVNGKLRHKMTTTTYLPSGKTFLNDMWWDENGKPCDKSHLHYDGNKFKFHFHHDLTTAIWVPFDRFEGGLVMVSHAGAGAVMAGIADPELYGMSHKARVKSGDRCVSVEIEESGRFQFPPEITVPGEALVEIVDFGGTVAASHTVVIAPALVGVPGVESLAADADEPALLTARGVGLAGVPETVEQVEMWSGALVLFEGEVFTDAAMPIAWSDREVLFRAPQDPAKLTIYDGVAQISEAVECNFTASPTC